MKNLKNSEINQLLEILSQHPRLRIAHFCDAGEAFVSTLNKLSVEKGYEYQLHILDDDFFKHIKDNYQLNEISLIRKIKWEQRRYASPALQYDLLFVTATVPEDYKEMFTKNIYSHIKSAGEIIMFLEKDNIALHDEWSILFEEYLFTAIHIEKGLFKNYDILIARKMHGWGGK